MFRRPKDHGKCQKAIGTIFVSQAVLMMSKIFGYLDPVLKSLVNRCPALGKLASGDLHVGVEMFSADG